MDSYIFKTSCGTMGYFQKDGDDCRLCLDSEYWPHVYRLKWSDWEDYKRGPYAQNMPESTLNDPLSQAMSYFVWHCDIETSPNIIEFNKSTFPPGAYCKRINRNSPDLYKFFLKEHSTVDEVRSFNNLMDSMNAIFNVVEPNKINLHTYGHRIREVLTIACTEVEYLLLQILKDNGYQSAQSSRFTTNDYVNVLPMLKLDEYSIELKMHPAMGLFFPFLGWNKKSPTKSLSWYYAYNLAKHDRGTNFHHATLGAVINAVAAVHILLESQYGNKLFEKPLFSEHESCFQTKKSPAWRSNEVFFPLIGENEKLMWTTRINYFKEK